MLIKSVKLENIRSYLNQVMEFPEGSLMLSGDIGSGKSTVLAAIEFALFGIKRGELSGAALLRNGKKQGSVELKINTDGKDIIIKRSLKRGKEDVVQDSGYIIKDELKKEATAKELKSEIFQLLGYPMSLVDKSQDMVYRYTVYTPQEQMKQIITESPETRMDTLRRVFGIDRYKRIRENSLVISKSMREKLRQYQGNIEDLEEKKNQKSTYEKNIIDINIKLEEVESRLKLAKEQLNLKKEIIQSVEKQIQYLNNLKKESSVLDANLSNKQIQFKKSRDESEKLASEISSLEKDASKSSLNIDSVKKEMLAKQEESAKIESKIKEIMKIISLSEAKKQNSEQIDNKIKNLDNCPLCLQPVKEDHKHSIHEKEQENIKNLSEEINKNKVLEGDYEKELFKIKKEIELLQKKESEASLSKLKQIHLEEKKKKLEQVNLEIKILDKEIKESQSKKTILSDEIAQLKDSEENYKQIKKDHEESVQKEREISLDNARLIKEKETLARIIKSIEDEISKKMLIKEKIVSLKEKDEWINEHFIPLMANIEKHVMVRILQEFDALLKEWFGMLIEDESLQVRLDDSFTPIIIQDGYEVGFDNLSGGERTSLALAYRLSLNKVINDLINAIKTKDLIILDEPTEGFSTEQLDRVREVLDQLHLKQIIIVSHEAKVEGFVDNIIKVVKEGHVSRTA